jgi:ribonuclease P protein component
MPPKKERLTKADFSKITKKTTLRNPLFDVVYIPSPTNKVGCVVLKKRTTKATDRNKIKRKIYHSYQETRPKTTYIMIFYPKNESLRANQKTIIEEMRTLFATL